MLEGKYDFRTAETRLQQRWAETKVYEFDPAHSGRPYTVDTPPPTVSGKIHMGHVYSYTQADVLIRYHRMKGEQVLYPFGFDDNGLPTEIFTENVTGMKAQDVGRAEFIKACLAMSHEAEQQFERFWKRLGLSVDWRLKYSTIDDRSRRVSQAAFLDLYEKGNVYRLEAPTLWCTTCRTGVAQADVEDQEGVETFFTTIPFALADGSGEVQIATTRPELLAACVAVFVHPNDERYKGIVGKTAKTPLFEHEVPVLADHRANPEKGTGAVMCCTFGDVTDVAWWREHNLSLRLALREDGRMNERAGRYEGLHLKQARARILEDLAAAGLVREQKKIEHTVGVHERCVGGRKTELDYLVRGQWFVKLLEHKQRWIDAGRRINWHPEHMRARYENWIEGLSWDWNISRQRYFGVPFPAWFCNACGSTVVASREQLPVDPLETEPASGTCSKCGGTELSPDPDVMDTWATSSVSPQICATLLEEFGITPEQFEQRYRPMTLRPNAHDIIRTWDFYTIVRSLYLTGEIPWADVLISGWGLDAAGKKISKSKISAADDPTPTLEQWSADAVRYWATGARTGADTYINDEVFKNGQRLTTKLWNAARLALSQLGDYRPAAAPPSGLLPTDRWLLSRLAQVIARATRSLDEYEYAAAKLETERFFWAELCDNYLELVKSRLYGDETSVATNGAASAGREAAQYTLYHAVLAVLKLLAPFMPHITEEIYTQGFATADGASSVHVAKWPVAHAAWPDAEADKVGEALLAIAEGARRWKADRKLSVAVPLASLSITCPAALHPALEACLPDVKSVTKAQTIALRAGDEIALEIEPAEART
ncbi:MAG TPA: valine--tRNA ligase [Chloroflexota bacterium]|nr:valine--tRNA ligase [Chloroflexota bacterium]